MRETEDPKRKKEIKEKLPYVTFSGTFSSRSNDKVIERSSYFCVDLDNVGDLKQIIDVEKVIYDSYPQAMSFISPSGTGLKIIFHIDHNAGSHLDFFFAIKNFIKQKAGKEIDESCKDISRACFLCHDPHVIIGTPITLGIEFLTEYLPLKESIQGKLFVDIIQNQKSPQITEEGTSYIAAKKFTDGKLTFKPGQRNRYIVMLADTCNRYGVSEQFLLSQIHSFVQEDFLLEEIKTSIRSRYNHQEWHGISLTHQLQSGNCSYIRIATDYYKIISKTNRWGITQNEYKRWTREAIVTDFGRKYLKTIPKYDDFCMIPDNLNYQQVINNQVNLYSPPCHKPKQGEWPWTKIFLKHIFGDQYDLGVRYMQILYCYPQWSTVILVLVSREQKTGKTTFVNWMSMISGNNSCIIASTDFQGVFNGQYATKNIIMIEETLFDKKLTIEKLKALATQKQISVNRKYIDQFNLEFFGKIILTSNYEDRFALVNEEETRFFVRKLDPPKELNVNIEDSLKREIPAFLYYLKNLPALERKDRSGFTTEELKNEFLTAVKMESKHETSKELRIFITDYFDNQENIFEFCAAAIDIKNKFFLSDHRTGASWLRRVLKDDFGMRPEKCQRYIPFGDTSGLTKTGRPYKFLRADFQSDTI